MVHVSAVIALASCLAVFAFPFDKRTVAEVQADIAKISAQVDTLDTAVNNFPATGGTVGAVLAINNDNVKLELAINQTTTDLTNTGSLSEHDANTILASLQAIEPVYIDALRKLVVRKPAFDVLPTGIGGISALIKQGLKDLNIDTTIFENALLAAFPPDLQDDIMAIKTTLDVEFANAIAAYA